MTKSVTASKNPVKSHISNTHPNSARKSLNLLNALASLQLLVNSVCMNLSSIPSVANNNTKQRPLSAKVNRLQRSFGLNVSWLNGTRSWPFSKMAATYFAKRLK